ncbi:MAG TPA: SDR family NAD(P)-dependent oxidoreductase [Actinomycetota bacterium]|jgi:NAD(P)-dependent dehydrogenase (short-subunit alcohol dehydrogenase family)|nr:SDR family NAD(P)-dependent oxidoreductase [Actinomycetota bacterium]
MRSLVTGAARGLGEGVAARLVADGGRVALVDVDETVMVTADRVQRENSRGEAFGIRCDVSDEEEVASAVGQIVERLDGIDLLVNNAGVGGPSTTVADTSIEEFHRVLDVNLIGTFLMSKACVRAMANGGCIVNMGSIFGQQGVPNAAAYCASKAAVALFTHSLALEVAPRGIRVNTIAPGNMLTEMHLADLRLRAGERGVAVDDEVEAVRASVPLERHGTGADVAGAVAWLASPDAAYVTGQTIGVNGGVVLT